MDTRGRVRYKDVKGMLDNLERLKVLEERIVDLLRKSPGLYPGEIASSLGEDESEISELTLGMLKRRILRYG